MPRFYSKVSHRFWTGETGKKLREMGHEAQLTALYLVTCQSSNMIGIYYLPLPLMAHELGMTCEGASKALRRVFEGGFACYDADSEAVFIPEMAAQQIGPTLKEDDNRRKGIIEDWQEQRKSPFYKAFWDRYHDAYGLPEPSPFEAPSKPLRSTITITTTTPVTTDVGEVSPTTPLDENRKKSKRKAFVRPSLDELLAYISEKAYHIDAEEFFAAYERQGWKLSNGRPMVDWKSALVTWEKNWAKHNPAPRSRIRPIEEERAKWNPVDGGITE